MDDSELLLEIDKGIAAIPRHLSDEAVAEGWTIEKAQFWRDFLTRLREQIETGASLDEYSSFPMCRVLDERDGIFKGGLCQSLSVISTEVLGRLGLGPKPEDEAEFQRRLSNDREFALFHWRVQRDLGVISEAKYREIEERWGRAW